ncbi:MAG: mannitol dehydrogenase family protein [Lachnospiraceae bacterium]|nr:mannitol dehydrogenase family protein [Lachnospiraceae bacterium]
MELTWSGIEKKEGWEKAGIMLPGYDGKAVSEATKKAPVWVHFGIGNIFRIFLGGIADSLLEQGELDRGITCVETFDLDVVDQIYTPYDNLALSVILHGDGRQDRKVLASLSEALKAQYTNSAAWNRLKEIFRAKSLQMVSLTITEKGYALKNADNMFFDFVEKDIENGPEKAVSAMAVVTAMLLERYQDGGAPLALVSMDNCSQNGEKLRESVLTMTSEWKKRGFVDDGFMRYVSDEAKISFPWTMIDKITPRPAEKIAEELEAAGVENMRPVTTSKRTYIAPFVNAEETEYLVIEDKYTNGRPPLELGGVLYVDRETVDKVERMKVCTCLNPLHTAMSIYGCILGYDLISAEMEDEDIRGLITKLGHIEAMPVVVDPGVLKPADFIDAVLNRRLPNPFMPDAPQRIATDTSQKIPIRFGETIKAYQARGLDMDALILLPLVLAGYARYLKGIDDTGKAFEPSPDPLLEELRAIVAPLEVKKGEQDFSCLKTLYSRQDVFGVDLYAAGLGERIEGMARELFDGPGAVRKTLHKYVTAR